MALQGVEAGVFPALPTLRPGNSGTGEVAPGLGFLRPRVETVSEKGFYPGGADRRRLILSGLGVYGICGSPAFVLSRPKLLDDSGRLCYNAADLAESDRVKHYLLYYRRGQCFACDVIGFGNSSLLKTWSFSRPVRSLFLRMARVRAPSTMRGTRYGCLRPCCGATGPLLPTLIRLSVPQRKQCLRFSREFWFFRVWRIVAGEDAWPGRTPDIRPGPSAMNADSPTAKAIRFNSSIDLTI